MQDTFDPIEALIREQYAKQAAGRRARERRESLGLTKAAVARSLGCSPTTISHMESGGQDPARLQALLDQLR